MWLLRSGISVFNNFLILQGKFSIHLAVGRVGLCLRTSKMGSTTGVCSGSVRERSPFVVLGQN